MEQLGTNTREAFGPILREEERPTRRNLQAAEQRAEERNARLRGELHGVAPPDAQDALQAAEAAEPGEIPETQGAVEQVVEQHCGDQPSG